MALSLSAKAFSVSAPLVWNSLLHNCCLAELVISFRNNLQSELFDTAYCVFYFDMIVVSALCSHNKCLVLSY